MFVHGVDRNQQFAHRRHEYDFGELPAIPQPLVVSAQPAARLVAELGDPAVFRSASALAAYVGAIPALRQSGKQTWDRAGLSRIGHAKLRAALWMPTLVAVRCNPWLRAYYQRLRDRGKLPKVALMAAIRKLLIAIYTVAKHRRPFVPIIPLAAP